MQSIASRRLSEALRPKVMSQSELAQKLGVSPQAVSKWVMGIGRPSADLMAQIEQMLGIPMLEWTEPVLGPAPDTEEPDA
jgi:transcriptional regulator with XRE-family HTH domain